METTKDLVAAAGDSVAAEDWVEQFESAFAYIAGRFGRVEPRRQARAFLLGLLSDVDTRSCWQLAEQAGDRTPHRMQRLLGEAVWDADAVRDDVRRYVVDELGDPGAVLIIDDTGDLQAGAHTVCVQRQYTGTAGRIENAQVAVFLAYASPSGYALVDREVYLPRCWTDDPARCAAAGVPEQVRFATKITLRRRMLTRALAAGIPADPDGPLDARRRPATGVSTRRRRCATPAVVWRSPAPARPGRTMPPPATGPSHVGPGPQPSAHHHRDSAPEPNTASIDRGHGDTPIRSINLMLTIQPL